MNKLIFTLGFIASTLPFLAGCDDNDPFAGNDNYIISFALIQDDVCIEASFQGDSILMLIPADFAPGGDITVEVTCSEHSTISPDPSTIRAWDDQQSFVVTSYNGNKRRYLYIPSVTGASVSGLYILTTQDEVDAFGSGQPTHLDGSLVIGRSIGTDSISSLEALNTLQTVTGSITINPTYNGNYLTGLNNLQFVGGNLDINGVDNLWTVSLPQINTIDGDLNINASAVAVISCPKLTEIGGSLTANASFTSYDFSALKHIGMDLSLLSSASVSNMEFQQLAYVGGDINADMSMNNLQFPKLTFCAGLSVGESSVGLLYCPLLQEITGALNIESNPLYEISFPELTHVGSVEIDCEETPFVSMPLLQSVDEDFGLTLYALNDVSQLSSLQSVGGEFSLTISSGTYQFPENLTQIGTYTVPSGMTTELDISGRQIGKLVFRGTSGYAGMTLTADDVFDGDIEITSLGGALPTLEGMKEINNFTANTTSSSARSIVYEINNVTKIHGDFSITQNFNCSEFHMDALEEVDGRFYIYASSSSSGSHYFPSLKTIGGEARIALYNGYHEQTFPKLETVGGDLTIKSGYGTGSSSIDEILYPSLTTVAGTLIISPNGYTSDTSNIESSSYQNSLLTNLDFLSSLQYLGGFRIFYHTALTSYEGLKNAIASCPEDNWYVVNNLYNPTYTDLAVYGLWTMPIE